MLAVSPEGLPIWPEGFSGSISHTDAVAIALVCRRRDHSFIGVDIEPIPDALTADAVGALIADDQELAHLAALSDVQSVIGAFCAKEALYKALLPGRFLDFDAARICGGGARELEIELTCDWTAAFAAGTVVVARLAVIDDHMVASVLGSRPHAGSAPHDFKLSIGCGRHGLA
ncbi:4'-phosphopantetheinyl transferase superfamily protein [Sphingomonas koreensis]|nr:4'-phosphopantetheinyl transferase superfamily protein [Sphingomonas koreensis]